jgi:hypothetical protein
MANEREKTTDEQEQIGRTTDEDATGAADDDFEDVDDDLEDDEDEDEDEDEDAVDTQ